MRILTTGTLDQLAAANPTVAPMLRAWRRVVEHATWTSPNDVRQTYASASIVANDRVVFNINGNGFRLIVAIDYLREFVFILWFGNHAAYNHINAATVKWKP